MATVIIGADICPIERNSPLFAAGDAKTLFNGLLSELQSADISIANLECPLIEKSTPIEKTGPVFGEPGACVNGIKNAGIDVLCLANNHILDHGPAGLMNTLAVCAAAGIETVGAGENLAAAGRMIIKTAGGIRIGILALAEYEFSIASENTPGANPIDLIEFIRTVNAKRGQFDYLIVLLHGSAEFHVPTPRIQKTCRFMVEMGANAVIVQHPHCLGGYEEFRGGHIVYGQGALIMDEGIYRDLTAFHEGYLVKLSVNETATATMEIIPYTQSDPTPGARLMTSDQQRQRFFHTLLEKTDALRDPLHVKREWERFCRSRKRAYMSSVLGHNRIFRRIDFGGWLTRLIYSRRSLLGVRNCILCETHKEALKTLFVEKM